MHAAITLTEIERAIATKDHTGKDNTNPPPCRGEPPPRTNNNDCSSICPPPAQYIPKQWLNDEDF